MGDPSDQGSKGNENSNEAREDSPTIKRPKNSVNGTNVHEHGISQFNPGSAVYYDAQSDLKLSRFLRRSQDKEVNASFGVDMTKDALKDYVD